MLFFPTWSVSQNKVPADFCVTASEADLFNMVNQLRLDYGKSKMQFSASLSYVAKMHVNDLQNNNPDTSICNLSSWSNNGNWTACCFTKYAHNPDCMWDKPKELTSFPYRGYEMVTLIQGDYNNDTVINLWSNSKNVLDMILARGTYSQKKWICGGIAKSDNYVALWFAQRKDKLGEPEVCDSKMIVTTDALEERKENVYYLIFGSFSNAHDAKEACRDIKKDNFKDCNILEKKNKFRVYLKKFSSMREAMFAKQQLPYLYKEAWILKD